MPISEPENKDLWETILEHREDVLIKDIELFRHHFVVWEWENGIQKVRIQDLSDGGTYKNCYSNQRTDILILQRSITLTLRSLYIAFGLEKLKIKKILSRLVISTRTDFDSVTPRSCSLQLFMTTTWIIAKKGKSKSRSQPDSFVKIIIKSEFGPLQKTAVKSLSH